MKKILTVYTGGTIGCAPMGGQRELNTELAKRFIALRFSQSDSQYAGQSAHLFEDSCLPARTLSENMTLNKLQTIIDHLRSFDLSRYVGVMIMHGTDTLAYTASLLSMLMCDISVPVMLVSGAKPPMVDGTNANHNFRAAVELILGGIAPNVYVPYMNSDGVMRLHTGSRLLQSANFSEDFVSAGESWVVSDDNTELLARCAELSATRARSPYASDLRLGSGVLRIAPYTGLDYSRIDIRGIKAVVHGTYHSGTFCVERNAEGEGFGSSSILHLAARCKRRDLPLFAAPCTLGDGQYSSVFDGVQSGGIVHLSMTNECAYTKALLGVSNGLSGSELVEYMLAPLNNEII